MRIYELNFRGAKLFGIKHDGKIVIPIAPICAAMTIDWEPQRQRIRRDRLLSKGAIIIMVPFTGGGPQSLLCLPLNRLHWWLSGIETGRIKDNDIRARVEEYQEECADALFVYFMPEYAAAMGVKLPTLEARLLHEDLFDQADARQQVVTITELDASQAARREDIQRAKDHLSEQIARQGAELQQAIREYSPLVRKDASEANVRIYLQVIMDCFEGCDPIAWPRKIKIADAHGKPIEGVFALDHATGNKSKNGLYEMIPTSKYWNLRLEKAGSKERWEPKIQQKMGTFFGYVREYTEQPSLFDSEAA